MAINGVFVRLTEGNFGSMYRRETGMETSKGVVREEKLSHSSDYVINMSSGLSLLTCS